jgi:hypothetical protein
LNILYYNSGWPINIGNAFIDYSSVYAIKTAVPQAKVYLASEMPKWIFWYNNRDMDRAIDIAEVGDIQFIVVSGMTMCDEFIAVQGPVLRKLSARGVKVVFSGCGAEKYTDQEIANFRKFLKELNLGGFIARDKVSYDKFHDLFPKSYCGIDCAFFLKEAFEPMPLTIKDYVVYNFDRIDEPVIDQPNPNIIRSHHSCTEVLQKRAGNRKFIFALSSRWPFIQRVNITSEWNRFLRDPRMLISDIPEDYLHLYASTSATYSDRVHACIATLSFGNKAKLFSDSPRGYLFERVGAKDLTQRLVQLDMGQLKIEKDRQLAFLKEILTA